MIDFERVCAILKQAGGKEMLQDQRHAAILEELKLKHAVKVTDLARKLEISESTIRRDINELDQQEKLKRVFGGAISLSGVKRLGLMDGVTDVAARSRVNVELKEQIARYAAALVCDDDFVFIDAGTTTERMLDYLENKRATYVTNGLAHARKLMENGFDAYMVGGLLRISTEAAIGTLAVESLKQYNFTKSFVGTNGVDLEKGFSTPDIGEAAVKTAVIKQSQQSYVLADHTKFGLISSVTFAQLADACIITNQESSPQYGEQTEIRVAE